MRTTDITPKQPSSIQRPEILRGRQLWGKSDRDLAAADTAVIGKSLEPTARGVRNSLEIYSQILQETRHSFRRVMRELAPASALGLAICAVLTMASSIGGLMFTVMAVGLNLGFSYFQAESENGNRIFNSVDSLRHLLAKIDPAVVRAGLQELKSENPTTYALITDQKALSGEMGKAYGAKFIDFLLHFEA